MESTKQPLKPKSAEELKRDDLRSALSLADYLRENASKDQQGYVLREGWDLFDMLRSVVTLADAYQILTELSKGPSAKIEERVPAPVKPVVTEVDQPPPPPPPPPKTVERTKIAILETFPDLDVKEKPVIVVDPAEDVQAKPPLRLVKPPFPRRYQDPRTSRL
jgi:hypothetical protein